MRRNGVPQNVLVVDKWGPPLVRICLQAQDNSRPRELATWSQNAGWAISESTLQKLKPEMTAAQMVQAMQQ